jgi:threonine dehydratase
LIALDEIRSARDVVAGSVLRTPLIRVELQESPAELYLKLENLQPIGSFKLRGALNALAHASREQLRDGVVTSSAGNMAQGAAWAAREYGVPCTVAVPETAPQTKLAAVERLGARVIRLSPERWWRSLADPSVVGAAGFFVHPFDDVRVMAGNGTIGLELLEDLPDLDAVVIPWGGGGLAVGIASAVRAERPEAQVFAAEPETGAPLAASFAAGSPQEVDYQPSFVDGAGGPAVAPTMWTRAQGLIEGSFPAPLDDVAAAVRLLAERAHVVAEGAGALALAAALSGRAGGGKIVCIVSGGNIDAAVLAAILRGEIPS